MNIDSDNVRDIYKKLQKTVGNLAYNGGLMPIEMVFNYYDEYIFFGMHNSE